MRHRYHRNQLSRPTGPRLALLRALAESLIIRERILTTEAKAKTLRPLAEKLITMGRKGTLHHRRQAFSILQKKKAVHKLFTDLAPRFATRPGGYTRIVHAGQREGDGAWMAYIELVDYIFKPKAPRPKKGARGGAPAPASAPEKTAQAQG